MPLFAEDLMTPAQAQALRLLIDADRAYRRGLAQGEPVSPDDRGVEVWAHGDIHPATARSLVEHGLAEMTDTTRNRSRWLFLGSVDPAPGKETADTP